MKKKNEPATRGQTGRGLNQQAATLAGPANATSLAKYQGGNEFRGAFCRSGTGLNSISLSQSPSQTSFGMAKGGAEPVSASQEDNAPHGLHEGNLEPSDGSVDTTNGRESASPLDAQLAVFSGAKNPRPCNNMTLREFVRAVHEGDYAHPVADVRSAVESGDHGLVARLKTQLTAVSI